VAQDCLMAGSGTALLSICVLLPDSSLISKNVLRDIRCEDQRRMGIAQDRVQWWALVLVVCTLGFCCQSSLTARVVSNKTNYGAQNVTLCRATYRLRTQHTVSYLYCTLHLSGPSSAPAERSPVNVIFTVS
jgi:uncharacterized membrane protein YhaH (DUF805 family)